MKPGGSGNQKMKKTFTNIHFDGYPTGHSVYTALKMQMYFANNSPFNLFF